MCKKCAFTGHRILEKDFDYNLLDRVIKNLTLNGVKTFYCGMAFGFDLACAESVLNLKKADNSVRLIACIPCPEQDQGYSNSLKDRYRRALENSDEVIILSPEYTKGCMFFRDRFMVDNCDVLLTYQRRKKGGTTYTVNYAKKKGIKIIEL